MKAIGLLISIALGLVGLALFVCVLPYLLLFWAVCLGGMLALLALGWLLT